MSDVSLVPVDHQPDFEGVSLVPVEHDPFSDDVVPQQAQAQAQTQPAQPELQQPPPGFGRIHVGVSPNKTQAPESPLSTTSTPQPPAPTQVGDNAIPDAMRPYGPTSNAVTPLQMLQGAVNQFYPGAQFTSLARQAFNNGQYGDAIGYGVGAVADSVLALAGGKLFGAGIASLKGIAGSSWALRRALERAGQVLQAGEATHHIVAKEALAADPARVILQRFGIDIHDAANGVFMRDAEHRHLHTNEYYKAVNKALAGAKSKAEAEQILKSIAQRLQSGTFP